jgi:ParB family chromosome partitioning protein
MATKRNALGRGLNALLPPPAIVDAGERAFMELPLEKIVPNKYQPRSEFNDDQLQSLAQSIQTNGLVQPVIVRKTGDQYELIAGERRWRAAQLAGLKKIPALIRDVSEYKSLELALIENIQRQDLNPLEEAHAYASLIEEFELTQEEVAQRVGKDRSSIANYVRLLKLPDAIKQIIQRQQLTMGHARALSGIEDESMQLEIARQVLEHQLNVRQTEQLIRQRQSAGRHRRKPESSSVQGDPNIKAAEQRLQEHFGTKVVIRPQSGSAGKVEVYYQDSDDLMRIYDLMLSNERDSS